MKKITQLDRTKAISGRCDAFVDDLDYIPIFEKRKAMVRMKSVKEHTPKLVL